MSRVMSSYEAAEGIECFSDIDLIELVASAG